MEEKVLEMEKLLGDVGEAYKKSEAQKDERRKKGECFNTFNVLGHWGEEVQVHSAFIAELLNPDGSHGCGGALLKKFCEITKTPFTCEGAIVYPKDGTEKSFCNDKVSGRFDIFIEQTDKKEAIVIENKVYAGDQDSQLWRYNEYCKGKYGSGNYKIFYLTLDGHEPSEYSSGVHDGAKDKQYWCDISYKNDILGWLNDCKEIACDKSRVKASIEQYIDLIKQITNDTLEDGMKNEVIKLLEEGNNLVLAQELAYQIEDAKFDIMQTKIIPAIKEKCKVDGWELIFEESEEVFGQKDSAFCFKSEKWTDNNLCISFAFDKYYGNFYSGIGKLDYEKSVKKSIKKSIEKQLQGEERQDDGYPLWGYMGDYCNWDAETIHNIVCNLDKFCDVINERVARYLKIIEDSLSVQ